MRFELGFEGAIGINYRRWHATIEAAEAEVDWVYETLEPDIALPRYEICDGDGRVVASTLIKAMK
jgi:hypothetical protein